MLPLGITTDKLPEGYTLINEPYPFYHINIGRLLDHHHKLPHSCATFMVLLVDQHPAPALGGGKNSRTSFSFLEDPRQTPSPSALF